MHLVIVTSELASLDAPSGGLATFTANLARIFRRNGHRVSIILVTTKKAHITFDEDISMYDIYVEKSIWDRFDNIAAVASAIVGKDQIEIRKLIVNIYKSAAVKDLIHKIHENEKIDLIHVCHLNSLAVALDDKIPYIVRISSYLNMCDGAEQPHGKISYEENPLSLPDKLDVYTLQKAKFVVSPSDLLAGIGRKNIGIDPFVIESPFVLDRDGWDDSIYGRLVKGKKYLIHYGRMSYGKGTHIVAQIAKELLERYPDMLIVLAGSSNDMLDAEGKRVKAHELVMDAAGEYADRIIYTGCLVRERLYPLIQHAQACILPSRIENLPNACIEAMAMGKIVIGTDGASFEQLIEDRVSGFLCRSDDPDSFLLAVKEALDMDDRKKRQMIACAAERIKELAPDVIYQKYYAFYQKVIEEWDCR